MTMLAGTIGHTFDGRVHRIQKVQRGWWRLRRSFYRMILPPYRGSHDLDPNPDLDPDPDPDPDLARGVPPIYISLSL